MRLIVQRAGYFFDVKVHKVCVDSGSLYRPMAKQMLDNTKVNTLFQQMRGKTMA